MPWPLSRKPEASSYREVPVPGVRRTNMESGPPKQSRFRDRELLQRPCRYFITAAERTAWRTFFNGELAFGTSWFDWPDPLAGGANKSARIVGGRYTIAPINPQATDFQLDLTIETYES